MEEAQTKQRGRRQTTIGTVVSNKMDKTVVVAVANTVVHRLYHRYMNRTTRFAAHDENNECLVGDRVLLVATRPLSKHKRWRVREILERGEER